MLGHHVIKGWSSTQSVVALSSGEAEYYGLVKGATIAVGVQSMLSDFGIECGIVMCTDASAAKGIASRRGLGKVRHIEGSQVWLQSPLNSGDVVLGKVDGKSNVGQIR